MASHLLPLTLSVTVVIDVRHAYIITLPALFINPSDYLTVTLDLLTNPSPGHSYVIIGDKGGIKHDGATERAIEYAGHNGARRPRKWCSQTA